MVIRSRGVEWNQDELAVASMTRRTARCNNGLRTEVRRKVFLIALLLAGGSSAQPVPGLPQSSALPELPAVVPGGLPASLQAKVSAA
jgi:hypothetical protein